MITFEDDNSGALSLSQLNRLVKEVIELSMDGAYWVEAEVANVNDSRGHCYMELVEKDERTNTPIAQARACCWASTWMRVSPKFLRATGEELRRGMKVLLRVKANFHEAYGFSWVVLDIDPTYTIGDMARRRQEIIRQLKEEGVIDLNKQLPIPMFAKRIAVISSPTAAGYGDFCNQLTDNEYGFAFQTRLFPAIMQGEQVEESVIAALNKVYEEVENFDIVVIIRGGGSTADLSGFDTLALAENVAQFPLPVITGIGHDRDQSVLDIVACMSVKTPTAVAAFLIDNLAGTLARIEEAAQRIQNAVRQRMEAERLKLQRMEHYLSSFFSLRKTKEESRIQNLATRLYAIVDRRLMMERNRLETMGQRLPFLASSIMQRETSRIQLLEQRVHAVDPINILRRGYSITLHEGTAVKGPQQVNKGDEVTILTAAGVINAMVK